MVQADLHGLEDAVLDELVTGAYATSDGGDDAESARAHLSEEKAVRLGRRAQARRGGEKTHLLVAFVAREAAERGRQDLGELVVRDVAAR